MEEHYITKQQAKILKLLGFPQDYCSIFKTENIVYRDNKIPIGDSGFFDFDYYAMVPLHIVNQWLREEKYIYIDITSETNGKWENGIVFSWSIMTESADQLITDYAVYSDYYEANSVAIDKALEILNVKNNVTDIFNSSDINMS